MNKEHLFAQIRKRVRKDPKIMAVYCFGSFASSRVGKESDFDLAFLVGNTKSVNLNQIYDLIKDLSFPKNLDISIVTKYSSPLFLYEIVAYGQRIYARSENKITIFEADILDSYYDTEHLRRIYASYLKNKFPLKHYANK